jgi:hypothetical protein
MRTTLRMLRASHQGAELMSEPKLTPWNRVARKFGLNQSGLAEAIGRHRSKISRALKDPDGLISGADQKRLLEAAASRGIDLVPSDLTP